MKILWVVIVVIQSYYFHKVWKRYNLVWIYSFKTLIYVFKAWDTVYGRVPQTIIDDENTSLSIIMEETELISLLKVSVNAYKWVHYVQWDSISPSLTTDIQHSDYFWRNRTAVYTVLMPVGTCTLVYGHLLEKSSAISHSITHIYL